MKAYVTIEFTVITILVLMVFVSVFTAAGAIKTQWGYEKNHAELAVLCNSIADSIVRSHTCKCNVSVFVPSSTNIVFHNGYVICSRQQITVVSPVPGGFMPKHGFDSDVYGWVNV